MKIRPTLLAVLVMLLLAGCKTSVETQVAISELLDGQTKVIPGTLNVEVSSCKDFRDTTQPSSSLLDVQTATRSVFPDSQYVDCFRKEYDFFARFQVPVYLDKTLDGKPASPDHINLVSNESVLLWVVIPEPVKKRMGFEKGKEGSSLDIDIKIKVVNDTGADFAFDAVSTFIDNSPAVYSSQTVARDAAFVLRLSDVSVQAALTGSGSPVLYLPAGNQHNQ